MFSDSMIADSFTLARTKCSYFINFRITPHLKELLVAKLKSSDFCVTCCSESLNWVFQEEQMDVVLRYFNNESCLVETSYFESAFINWPNSPNLYDKLLESLYTLYLRKLLQELMVRPNINWDVLKLHASYTEQGEFSKLTNIGICGLLVLHVTLRTGLMETDQKINKALHVIWETGCDIFPLHFCKTRWVEDEPVAAWGYGRILSRLWSTGFHCQKVNVHVITNHLIPWSSTIQINWWSLSSIF